MKTERRLSSEEEGLKGARELAVCLGDAKRGVPCSHAQEGPRLARPAHAHHARDPESGPVTQGRGHSQLPTKTTALQSQPQCGSPPSLPPPLHTHVLHTHMYVRAALHPPSSGAALLMGSLQPVGWTGRCPGCPGVGHGLLRWCCGPMPRLDAEGTGEPHDRGAGQAGSRGSALVQYTAGLQAASCLSFPNSAATRLYVQSPRTADSNALSRVRTP